MTTTPEPASPDPEPTLQEHERQAAFDPADYIVPGHRYGCDGTCNNAYPDGCSPF